MSFPFEQIDPTKTRVLKSSSKYLIFSCEAGGTSLVIKIAHTHHEQLTREVERIQSLKQAYPVLGRRLPSIVASGAIPTGLHAGKAYYAQEYLSGKTFSHVLQSGLVPSATFSKAVSTLVRTLCDLTLEHQCDEAFYGQSGSFLREAVIGAYRQAVAFPHINHVDQCEDLVINGPRMAPLKDVLQRIVSSPILARIERVPSCISSLGHWNFHGDNILLESVERAADVRVIDPDTKIEQGDPLFGLARFFYTFPHDTADYGQYVIHSSMMTRLQTGTADMDITCLWPHVVYEQYQIFSRAFLDAQELISLDARFADERLRARLILNMLLCLLRGVSANYDEAIEFVEGSGTAFRHKGIFFYLQACLFASTILEKEVMKISHHETAYVG